MGRFTNNRRGDEAPQEKKINVDDLPTIGGNYQCQTCGAKVRGAHYDASNWTLVWKCSEGHVSAIGDFVI